MKKKKIVLWTLLTSLSLASLPLTGAAAELPKAAVVEQSVSFRTQPSTSGGLIRYLRPDEQVSILEQTNAYWYRVKDSSGKTGYISTNDKYTQIISAAPSSNAAILSGVNFRKSPSASGAIIRMLEAGEQVQIVSKVNSYWYQIKDSSGTAGYVSTNSRYIQAGEVPGAEPAKPVLSPSEQAEAVIAAGMKYLGTPYEYGSDRNTTATFDCSDFVRTAFKDALGKVLPADSRGQGDHVTGLGNRKTDWHTFERGDLIFFMPYKGYKASDYAGIDKETQTITHVGIYLGNGQVLHTYSQASGGVRVDSFEGKAWEYRILFGGSALK
ncbi:C40 family peptidase [Paenibacillus gansuensis]|uniref:SH3 domain-containing protein n=1 Tax=Paenibacillus gansuensis TaxID=306542 RepID=A0ABW5PG39_9BACL